MTTLSLVLPQIGQPDTTEDVKLINGFTAIQSVINGNLDSTNLSAATSQAAGINASGQIVKGASIIATTESRTNVAYGTLTTPDQVTNVVLPTNGLIAVLYQATWQNSVASAGAAAIFLNANQLVAATSGSAAPAAQSAVCTSGTAVNVPLASSSTGLLGGGGGTNYTGDATTGQIIGLAASGGGPAVVFAAAGTYTVSVQFKASSGTVTAANRRLYVMAVSYA